MRNAHESKTGSLTEQQPVVGGPAKVLERMLRVDDHPVLGAHAPRDCRIEPLGSNDVTAHRYDAPLKFRERIASVPVGCDQNVARVNLAADAANREAAGETFDRSDRRIRKKNRTGLLPPMQN